MTDKPLTREKESAAEREQRERDEWARIHREQMERRGLIPRKKTSPEWSTHERG